MKKKKVKLSSGKNKRLDIFLRQLEIQKEKREQIVKYVEDLTFGTLKEKVVPQLRLKK